MVPLVYSTTSFAELERFITGILCEQERLDAAQVQVKRTLMRQGPKVIGVVIRVAGPRLLTAHAIWAEHEHRLLFYNSAGNRFAEVKLAEAPELGQYHLVSQ